MRWQKRYKFSITDYNFKIYNSDLEAKNILNKNQTINAQNFFMLVGHGLLHLFGYAHYDKQSRSNMRFLENTFMLMLGLKKVHED